MQTLNDYLDMAKKITRSDRQTALRIGCTPQYLSSARKGRGFSDMYSFELAELIEVDPSLIVAASNHSSTLEKKYWKEKWEALAGRVAGFLLVVALLPYEVIGKTISIMLSKVRGHLRRRESLPTPVLL